ncbi:MAG: heme-binding domain-containing protein [Candidatus Eisenbacteria bacterium]|uniref:Heme-binding domain-containing protein n=1 Tax=Eiseniibacteriota bacterium TaxID=2212470 RepID=A0A849SHN9_UNCEI|nr:heme-binding domain-containing protein [Candidatus Eisenbacteria bacterium]
MICACAVLLSRGGDPRVTPLERPEFRVPEVSLSNPQKFLIASGVALLLFGGLQLVPYGRDHSNPPVVAEPTWVNAETRALAKRACFDCHSNETRWPWYASVAPISWKLKGHVDEGREELNFSEFDSTNRRMMRRAGKSGREVREGKMPPSDYVLAHPDARLTGAGREAFARALDSTFAAFLGREAPRER